MIAGAVFVRGLRVVRSEGRVPRVAPRRWLAIAVGGLLVGVVVAVIATPEHESASSWSGQDGVNMRAGFIDGCAGPTGDQRSICECIFERVRDLPQYDTPREFASLANGVERADQIPTDFPTAIVGAARACGA